MPHDSTTLLDRELEAGLEAADLAFWREQPEQRVRFLSWLDPFLVEVFVLGVVQLSGQTEVVVGAVSGRDRTESSALLRGQVGDPSFQVGRSIGSLVLGLLQLLHTGRIDGLSSVECPGHEQGRRLPGSEAEGAVEPLRPLVRIVHLERDLRTSTHAGTALDVRQQCTTCAAALMRG